MVNLSSVLLFCSKDKFGTSFPSYPFQDRIFYLQLSTCLRVCPPSERTSVLLENSGQLLPLSPPPLKSLCDCLSCAFHHIVPWWQINLLTYKAYYNINPPYTFIPGYCIVHTLHISQGFLWEANTAHLKVWIPRDRKEEQRVSLPLLG